MHMYARQTITDVYAITKLGVYCPVPKNHNLFLKTDLQHNVTMFDALWNIGDPITWYKQAQSASALWCHDASLSICAMWSCSAIQWNNLLMLIVLYCIERLAWLLNLLHKGLELSIQANSWHFDISTQNFLKWKPHL